MSNIIRFRPAKELVIETSLKSVTLADVLNALTEQTDLEEIMITARRQGELYNYSNLTPDEREKMIVDLYDSEEEF